MSTQAPDYPAQQVAEVSPDGVDYSIVEAMIGDRVDEALAAVRAEIGAQRVAAPPTGPRWLGDLSEAQVAALDWLRRPTEEHETSYKPQVTCYACRDASDKVCGRHAKRECDRCRQYVTTGHIDLPYMGHAAVTARLVTADPTWGYTVVANPAERGLPVVSGGMWIELTVCGVTRLGFGDAQGKTGPNAIKEVIGDAIRNAGMRFGCGLDLWHKGDTLWGPQADPASEDTGSTPNAQQAQTGPPREAAPATADRPGAPVACPECGTTNNDHAPTCAFAAGQADERTRLYAENMALSLRQIRTLGASVAIERQISDERPEAWDVKINGKGGTKITLRQAFNLTVDSLRAK